MPENSRTTAVARTALGLRIYAILLCTYVLPRLILCDLEPIVRVAVLLGDDREDDRADDEASGKGECDKSSYVSAESVVEGDDGRDDDSSSENEEECDGRACLDAELADVAGELGAFSADCHAVLLL